jgi:hypothetical protein
MKITKSAGGIFTVQRGLIFVLLVVLTLPYPALAATTPKDSSAKLRFSAAPTESEIFNTRVFDEPLIPAGSKPTGDKTNWMNRDGYAPGETLSFSSVVSAPLCQVRLSSAFIVATAQ